MLEGASRLLRSGAISYVIFEIGHQEQSAQMARSILETYGYECYSIARNADFLVRDLANYPTGELEPPLNMLAVSPAAHVHRASEVLDIRG